MERVTTKRARSPPKEDCNKLLLPEKKAEEKAAAKAEKAEKAAKAEMQLLELQQVIMRLSDEDLRDFLKLVEKEREKREER
jgi:hypothetical protein